MFTGRQVLEMQNIPTCPVTCRATAPAAATAQQLPPPRPRFQEGLTLVHMAPLAAPGTPALEAAPAARPAQAAQSAQATRCASAAHLAHTPPVPQAPAAARQPGSSGPAQPGGSCSRQKLASGKQEQGSVPHLNGRKGRNGNEPEVQRHQRAVVYSLSESPGNPHHAAASSPAAGQQAKPAISYSPAAGSVSDSPASNSGSPGSVGTASTSKPKAKAELSIAQQAVLRCRQKQLAMGEPHQDLQARRQHLEDASSGSASKQEAMSPSQANGMSRGRMMHAHLAPAQPRSHESECGGSDRSEQEVRQLHSSQELRGDSGTGQRPLPAGAKRGMQALGVPLHGSPMPDSLKELKPDPSSSGVSLQSRQPGRHQHQALAARDSPQADGRPSSEQEAARQSQGSAGAGSLLQQPSAAAVTHSPLKQIPSTAAVASVTQVRHCHDNHDMPSQTVWVLARC